jgi:putative DNA primase/helicase
VVGQLPSRFLILSNELPRFGDAPGAIANRFVVLAMHESFLGRENTTLIEELTAELPGILSWSLDGLDRLNRQGKFTEPKASTDSILALQDLVSPVAAYVRDNCEVGIGHEIPIAGLYADWKTWCDDNGHKPGTNQTFGRDLRAVIPHLRVVRPNDEGSRVRHFQGVRLRTAHNGFGREPSQTGAESEPNPTSADPADQCTLCGNPLMAPRSRQRGICESCWLRDEDGAA